MALNRVLLAQWLAQCVGGKQWVSKRRRRKQSRKSTKNDLQAQGLSFISTAIVTSYTRDIRTADQRLVVPKTCPTEGLWPLVEGHRRCSTSREVVIEHAKYGY